MTKGKGTTGITGTISCVLTDVSSTVVVECSCKQKEEVPMYTSSHLEKNQGDLVTDFWTSRIESEKDAKHSLARGPQNSPRQLQGEMWQAP